MSREPLRVVIVDDEPAAREDLRRLLTRKGVTIAGEASRVAEARELLSSADYDVAFLDVQLRGGTGFDLMPHVRPGKRVIFVTGHERFALRAFEVNALDYLLKPVDEQRLAESLQRLEPVGAAAALETPATETPGTAAALTLEDCVFVKADAGATRFVPVRDIAVIFSNENYTELHLAQSQRLLVRRTLKAWEEQLPGSEFMRVHRTALVNLRAIERTEHVDRETTHLFVIGRADQPVRARRELWTELERRLVAVRARLSRNART